MSVVKLCTSTLSALHSMLDKAAVKADYKAADLEAQAEALATKAKAVRKEQATYQTLADKMYNFNSEVGNV